MKNCIVAQSGGPTSVINASVIGVFEENLKQNLYENVYCGLNGIEGILDNSIINLSEMNNEEIKNFKYTPSSGLGSCRYKLESFNDCRKDYLKLFEIFSKLDIDTFFYIGGNDSMDTVNKLSKYARKINSKIKFIGIPKTIDNDLCMTDHTPGFGSAAKLIATTVLETYLDSSVYLNNGIFILETMGRNAGWLGASAILAQLNGKPVADFIYLPEKHFKVDQFLKEVKEKYEEQNKVYIVVSEGIKNVKGEFIVESEAMPHDEFGHKQLGGVGDLLKEIIIDSGITSRVKALELGVIQRCAMHCASLTDVEEAYKAGVYALKLANDNKTGVMVAFKRTSNNPYKCIMEPVDVKSIANRVKYFPKEWINKEGNHINKEALEYFIPLIEGNPKLEYEHGLPVYNKLI